MPRQKTILSTGDGLTHLNECGEAHMVDISQKSISERTATATGLVTMQSSTLAVLEAGVAKKGDVLATARIAGIMAAKRTHELIPLCHPLALCKIGVTFTQIDDPCGLKVTTEVKTSGRTGVEMEALTAASISCLTVYDMLKAIDKTMIVQNIQVLEKTGGTSGPFYAKQLMSTTTANESHQTATTSHIQAERSSSLTDKQAATRESPSIKQPKNTPKPSVPREPPWDI